MVIIKLVIPQSIYFHEMYICTYTYGTLYLILFYPLSSRIALFLPHFKVLILESYPEALLAPVKDHETINHIPKGSVRINSARMSWTYLKRLIIYINIEARRRVDVIRFK